MQTFTQITSLQDALARASKSGQRIALVPTMGNLHNGHLALVKRAKALADIVVVSIFVNPLQFAANEDLATYPRTLVEDSEKLQKAGVNFLFTPHVDEIYPQGQQVQTQVCVPVLTENFCGKSRPGHFNGVSTIVCKLLNIVQPDIAVFGEKDYQQLAVIRKMTEDLCMPIEIIGVETHRDSDGLALSSRNQYLSVTERNTAPLLYKTLQQAQSMLMQAPLSLDKVYEECHKTLEKSGFIIDYFTVCDAVTLAEVTANTQHFAILAAAYLGNTRLIDNLHFSLND